MSDTPQSAGQHEWVAMGYVSQQSVRYDWPFCKICGVVQRRDGKNAPCKGPTKLRKMEGEDE